MGGYAFPYIDSYYIILVIPTILLSFLGQIWVKSTFNRYSKIKIQSSMLGVDVAKKVLDTADVSNVNIERTGGFLTDHFDPRRMVLRLSEAVYGSSSISAAGVAAHEAGHAVQKKRKYIPLVLRSTLVPVANIGSTVGPYLALFGIILSNKYFLKAGIVLFAASVLFYIITLPVEFNASRRALRFLRESGILESSEIRKFRKVLTAAAFTYVAAALTQLASLVRLILIAKSRDRS